MFPPRLVSSPGPEPELELAPTPGTQRYRGDDDDNRGQLPPLPPGSPPPLTGADGTARRAVSPWTTRWWRGTPALRLACSVTGLFMTGMTVVFVTSLVRGGMVPSRQNPTLGASSCTLLSLGANYAPLVVRRGEVWRLLTSVVVSSGFFTYFVYMFLFLGLVFPCEVTFGAAPTAAVFWAAGVLANVFACSASIDIDTGAGGALMGVVGFRVGYIVTCWHALTAEERRRVGLLEILSSVLLFFTGLSPNVDNSANFAGFVVGAFVGAAYFAPSLDATPVSRFVARAMAVLGVSFVTAIWIALVAGRGFALIENVVLNTVCQDGSSSAGAPSPLLGDR